MARHSFSVNLLSHRLVYVQCCEHNGRLCIQHRQSPSEDAPLVRTLANNSTNFCVKLVYAPYQ